MKTITNSLFARHGRTLVIGLIGALLLSGLWLASSHQALAAEKKYVLKLASVYNSKHPSVANGLKPWIENLKAKSNGRLVVQFYEPNTLAPRNEHMESVRSGIADISYEVINNDYQLSAVVSFPFMFQSVEAASRTRWEMLQRYPEMMAEYKGVKIIWGHTSAFFQLHMKKKQFTKVD